VGDLLRNRHRQRLQRLATEHEREQELVPGENEAQDRGSDDAVSQQGKDDATKVLQLRPSSVRCLLISLPHHHEYRTVPVPA
jgi:hypothetical protein